MRNELYFLTIIPLVLLCSSCEEETKPTSIEYKKVKLEAFQKSYDKNYKWDIQAIRDSIQFYVDSAQAMYKVKKYEDTSSLFEALDQKKAIIDQFERAVKKITVGKFLDGPNFRSAASNLLNFYSSGLESYYRKALELEIIYKDDPVAFEKSRYSFYMTSLKEDEKIRMADYVAKKESFWKRNL